jgi:hypothetical protein
VVLAEEKTAGPENGRESAQNLTGLIRGSPAKAVNNGNELLSDFEERVDSILNKLQIRHITQHHIEYTSKEDGSVRIYTPDFDLESPKCNGKTVILEPHGGDFFNYDFIRKMKRFMESKEHDDYYLIIITEMPIDEIKRRLANTRVSKHSDQIFQDLQISDICDKLINTRKRSPEEMQQPYAAPPEVAGKPYAYEAEKVAAELGGMGEFDELEFIRALIRFKKDGVID